MELKQFIKIRPHIYHLTDKRNLDSILSTGKLLSTKRLVAAADLKSKKEFLTTRRKDHEVITAGGVQYYIRDQRPLSLKILDGCLDKGVSKEDFISYLNSKVFMWGKMAGLESHYARYIAQDENPIILRFNTEEVFSLNKEPKFTRLNSGAPRSSSYLGGKGSPRGLSTFESAIDYSSSAGTINEVVFDEQCVLPETIYLGYKPQGPFKNVINK
jgi:hypothetical protein